MKKKVRSVASVSKIQDEMKEELIAEHMRQIQSVDNKEELWHRRRVRNNRGGCTTAGFHTGFFGRGEEICGAMPQHHA